jgi:hypothetical protein
MTESGGGAFDSTREKAIDALCEHFANDALSVEEFERRVDQAHRAENTQQLRELLADLPSGDLPIKAEDSASMPMERFQASVPASRVKERGFVMAVLGGVERKGRWIPARQTYAVALLGGVELDFREALLPPGETDVWILTAMGGVEIIVPPGLNVESDGVAILGGFEHREEATLNDDPDAPVLRIRGLALLGGVEVSHRYPGETPGDAKRRHRLDRKKHRLDGRRHKRLGDGS